MRIDKYKKKKENIWNLPNTLTFSRVILTFVIMYLIFLETDVRIIAFVFIIAMVTDFFDGQIARRFNRTTEFGRKFDMISDRVLMFGTILAVLIEFGSNGYFDKYDFLQIFLIMSREIVTFPFAFIVMTAGKGIPKARFIGKLTTFMQGVSFPAIILGAFYHIFSFSIYLSIATGVIGVISAITYIKDAQELGIQDK